MSIPWILVLYKKRKRIAEAVSFLLLSLLFFFFMTFHDIDLDVLRDSE